MKKIWNKLSALYKEVCEDLDVETSGVLAFVALVVGGLISFGVLVFLALTLFWSFWVWICWNGAAAPVFGLAHVSFWQAVGLTMLARILIRRSLNWNLNTGGD